MYNLIQRSLTEKNIQDIRNVFLIYEAYNLSPSSMQNGYPEKDSFLDKFLFNIDPDEYIHKNMSIFSIETGDFFINVNAEKKSISYSYIKNDVCVNFERDSIEIISYTSNIEENIEDFLRSRFSNYGGNRYNIAHRFSFDMKEDHINITEFQNLVKNIDYSNYDIGVYIENIAKILVYNEFNKKKEFEEFLLLNADISLEDYFPYKSVCDTFESLHKIFDKNITLKLNK